MKIRGMEVERLIFITSTTKRAFVVLDNTRDYIVEEVSSKQLKPLRIQPRKLYDTDFKNPHEASLKVYEYILDKVTKSNLGWVDITVKDYGINSLDAQFKKL